MKIKNEFIKIKTDKEYTLRNYIYNNYLSGLSKMQYTRQSPPVINNCYLKLEIPLDDARNANVEDFDFVVHQSYVLANTDKSKLECNYVFKANIYDQNYIGKKITAIGFATDFYTEQETQICACVDTSDYSIYISEEMVITRKDVISSDAICSEIAPMHLTPVNINGVSHFSNKLYSIGLGTRLGEMDEEYIIGEDIDINVIDDFSFSFKLRKGLDPNKYPTPTTYTNNLYPLPVKVIKEIHPNMNLYASSNKVPLASDYKYIIYKYRYYDWYNGDYHDLDEYFTVSLPNDTKGLFEIVTKIERSDV